MTIASYLVSPNLPTMQKLIKNIDTAVIRTMIAAYSANYGRVRTAIELADSNATIRQLQAEIASRVKTNLQSFFPVVKVPLLPFRIKS